MSLSPSRVVIYGHEVPELYVLNRCDIRSFQEGTEQSQIGEERIGAPLICKMLSSVDQVDPTVAFGETAVGDPHADPQTMSWLQLYDVDSGRRHRSIRIRETKFARWTSSGRGAQAVWHNSKTTDTDAKFNVVYVDARYGIPEWPDLNGAPILLQLAVSGELRQRQLAVDGLITHLGRIPDAWWDRLTIVTSASFLRQCGCTIKTDLSWESQADWLACDKNLCRKPILLQVIYRAKTVVVRCDKTSAVIKRGEKYDLVFANQLVNASVGQLLPGHLTGFTSTLSAGIVAALVNGKSMKSGVANGLKACLCHYLNGFTLRLPNRAVDIDRCWPKHVLKLAAADHVIGHVRFKTPSRRGSTKKNWCIVERIAEHDALGLAWTIVKNGLPAAQKKYRLPIAVFGKATVASRLEYECYSEIQRNITNYVKIERQQKPISIAIFGQPGAGKSFAMDAISASVTHPRISRQPIGVNLSQIEDDEELRSVFQRARDVSLGGEVPVVNFDEFDAKREGEPFGWLRQFLMPMQDGKYVDRGHRLNIGSAVFFFAGGTFSSFQSFAAHMSQRKYKSLKGPDFVSRIKGGYLDVAGFRGKPGNVGLLVRRAIVLRNLLEKFQPSVIGKLTGKAQIDKVVAKAILMAPEYTHGARSMEAIVSMCRPNGLGPRLDASSLPSVTIRGMHVGNCNLLRL